jgi:predicted RNA-binding Zn ribbon-like protein
VYISKNGINRLGVCQAPSCGNVFFDDTANRSRRYCSERCADLGPWHSPDVSPRERGHRNP